MTPGSSTFSESNLYIWKFLVHVLLKPSLKDFEHYLAHMKWGQLHRSLNILWHCLSSGLKWKVTFFQFCGHWWVFQICWHAKWHTQYAYWVHTFTASSFRTWKSLAAIPSPPLALFVVMLPKAHLTSDSRTSGSRWVITPLWLSGLLRPFLCSSSVYSCGVPLPSPSRVHRLQQRVGN